MTTVTTPLTLRPPLPRSLYVETTSRCNSKCQTCILTFGGREPAEDLTWPRFRQIVDQFPRSSVSCCTVSASRCSIPICRA